jgi:hypothetical protein
VEHACARERSPRVGIEEVDARGDRGANGLLAPGIGRPGARGRHAAEPFEQRRRRQNAELCHGDLDRERQPLEALADLGNEIVVLGVERKVSALRICAGQEQLDRIVGVEWPQG